MPVQVVPHAARQTDLVADPAPTPGRAGGSAGTLVNGSVVSLEPPGTESATDVERVTGTSTPAELRAHSGFTDWVAAHRLLAALVILPLWLAAFNGQWRVGLDSAVYRTVARSLAEHQTYSYGVLPETHVFPGLPVILAGVQRLFGDGDLAPLLLMNLTALAILVVTYRLIRTHFDPWIATTVACGMALNGELLSLSQEILTDVPFLLGVVTAWWGWEKLRGSTSGVATDESSGKPSGETGSLHGKMTGSILLVLGLALAASLRPTFWVVAAAWWLVSLWKLFHGEQRRLHASVVAVVCLIGAIFIVVDPRINGLDILSGGYEKRAVEALGEIDSGVIHAAIEVITRRLTEGFFGEPMSPFGIVWATPLLFGLVLVTRRVPLWGMTAWVLIGTTIMLSAQPRYYLMVLPVMWLGWVLCAAWVWERTKTWLAGPKGSAWQAKLPPDFAGFMLSLVILLVPLTNSAQIASTIWEQRQPAFLAHYSDGHYLEMQKIAESLAAHTEPDDIILGPEGSVLTYYARRTVIGDAQLSRAGGADRALERLRGDMPDWGIFPPPVYRHKDPTTFRLLDSHTDTASIVAVQPVIPLHATFEGSDLYLAKPVEPR